MNTGERQHKRSLAEVKPNHLARYLWAIEELNRRIPKGSLILDAAAGTGYGSYMLAKSGYSVHAIDNAPEAHEWQKEYFPHESVMFSVSDLSEAWLGEYAAVVSIETIEHIENDGAWIDKIGTHSNLLIGTVPNEDVVPFNPDKHPFHYRHYTQREVEDLLMGWNIAGWFTQYDKWNADKARMRPGTNGMTLGFVAEKP